jgi:hypothetical protein
VILFSGPHGGEYVNADGNEGTGRETSPCFEIKGILLPTLTSTKGRNAQK